MAYNDIKNHKKSGFRPFSRRHILEKQQEGQIDQIWIKSNLLDSGETAVSNNQNYLSLNAIKGKLSKLDDLNLHFEYTS